MREKKKILRKIATRNLRLSSAEIAAISWCNCCVLIQIKIEEVRKEQSDCREFPD